MSVLKMYFASNDVQVSEQGTFTNAISFTLRADLNESEAVRLYAKCDATYQATSVTVEGAGSTVARWELNASTDVGEPGAGWVAASTGISLGTVTTAERYFWVRASAINSESIGVDNTVTLQLEGIGESV